jgi:thiol-disulfide isomerase/thioredoxin
MSLPTLSQLVVAFSLLLPLASAAPGEVIVANKANWEGILKKNKHVFVMVYAPWCGRCKAYMPKYEKAAKLCHEAGLKTQFVKVDGVHEKDMVRDIFNGHAHFPVMHWFVDGKKDAFENHGTEEPENYPSWIKVREVFPMDVIEEAGVQDFLGKAAKNEYALVARVKKNSVRDKAYREIVQLLGVDFAVHPKQYSFAVVYLPTTADAKKDSSLVMRRVGFDELGQELDVNMAGSWTKASIKTWIETNSYKLVADKLVATKYLPVHLDEHGYHGSVVAILDDSEGADEDLQQKVKPLLQSLALKYPKWAFVIEKSSDVVEKTKKGAEDGDGEGDIYNKLLAYSGTGSCITVVHAPCKTSAKCPKVRYTFYNSADNEITDSAKVDEFFRRVEARDPALVHIQSQEAPENPMGADHVLNLVTTTFNETVMDPTKDVLVEFYSKSCGHCMQLAPIWSELGERAKLEDWDLVDVVIAKVDQDLNEAFEQLATPRIVLFPAVPAKQKMKKKVAFTAHERSLEQLLDFLLEHAKNLNGVELKGEGSVRQLKQEQLERGEL